MAARTEPARKPSLPELLDLRHLCADDLKMLLAEEISAWRDTLDWDFEPSADLVRRFIDLRGLSGFALMHAGVAAGYCYYVQDDHKALIGDLYVQKALRSVDNENRLLAAVLDAMMQLPQVSRIESQLMMVAFDAKRVTPHQRFLRSFDRQFMSIKLDKVPDLPSRERREILIEPWYERYQEASAQLIASAYQGHIDGQINDQYRSVEGARRFLYNIIQYPGCGAFFKPASYAAFERGGGRLCGLSLASLVAKEVGHITQICVSTRHKKMGIGYELLRQSLSALREHGCRSASLTVTASNQEAIQLYERVGFTTIRHFAAYVWEGF